jgi:hypothetical protein
MDICLSPARAAASRRNGARSRGPKTPEGKARSAQNALKHGMRAQKCIVLPGERASAFEAFEAALLEELAPEGALQAVLAQRVVAASWRLARAERLEAELFAQNMLDGRGLGLALVRDCNGARAFDTLLRYRGGTLAELWRALRTLKALQAEAAARAEPAAPRLLSEPQEMPIKSESREKPGSSAPPPAAKEPAPARATDRACGDAMRPDGRAHETARRTRAPREAWQFRPTERSSGSEARRSEPGQTGAAIPSDRAPGARRECRFAADRNRACPPPTPSTAAGSP